MCFRLASCVVSLSLVMCGGVALRIMSRIPNPREESASLRTDIKSLTAMVSGLSKMVRKQNRKGLSKVADADAAHEEGVDHTNTKVIVASDGDGADGNVTRTPTLHVSSDDDDGNMEGNRVTMATDTMSRVAPGTLTLPLELPSRLDGLIIPAPNTVQILMTTPQFPRPKITLKGMESYEALSLTV